MERCAEVLNAPSYFDQRIIEVCIKRRCVVFLAAGGPLLSIYQGGMNYSRYRFNRVRFGNYGPQLVANSNLIQLALPQCTIKHDLLCR